MWPKPFSTASRRAGTTIFPDPMSASVYEAWKKDHKAVERQFAA